MAAGGSAFDGDRFAGPVTKFSQAKQERLIAAFPLRPTEKTNPWHLR